MKNSLKERVKQALHQDNSLVVSPDAIKEGISGFSEPYLSQCGLRPQDLKRLEIEGHAKRGHALLSTTTKVGNKKQVTELRWVLLQSLLKELSV